MAEHEFEESRLSSRPPKAEMAVKIPILRVPARGMAGARILSHDVVGSYTHYAHGRTQPCDGDGCEYCEQGTQRRWRGYLMIVSTKSGAIVSMELTAASMARIDQHFRAHRTLRGSSIRAERKGGRENGELMVFLEAKSDGELDLPKAPSQRKWLEKLWGIKLVKPTPLITDEIIRLRDEDDFESATGTEE